jgi:hypothetical protein
MGMEVTNVSNKILALGDNIYESGYITVPAETTYKAGTVLKRLEQGSFAPVTDTQGTPGTHGTPASGGGWEEAPTDPVPGDVPVAVIPFNIENKKAQEASIGFRALVSGRVRLDMLRINGSSITQGQSDMLRNYGILPVKVTNLSQLDNQ